MASSGGYPPQVGAVVAAATTTPTTTAAAVLLLLVRAELGFFLCIDMNASVHYIERLNVVVLLFVLSLSIYHLKQ